MNYIHDPKEIEKKSFETISQILGDRRFDLEEEPVIKRVIHTTADFEYADLLEFSPGCLGIIKDALKAGADIITDTKMAREGINKTILSEFGGMVNCYISDESVINSAKAEGVTRAMKAVDVALLGEKPQIFAVGNAPTALFRLAESIKDKKHNVKAIIAAPVGFVNVVEAKEVIKLLGIPYIAVNGRKGGSTVAAAIMNAILYSIVK